MPKLYPPFFKFNGPVVRDLLARRHWGQEVLAAELGITRGYACQLLNGRRLLSPKLRRRVLDSKLFEGLAETDIWIEVDEDMRPLETGEGAR